MTKKRFLELAKQEDGCIISVGGLVSDMERLKKERKTAKEIDEEKRKDNERNLQWLID